MKTLKQFNYLTLSDEFHEQINKIKQDLIRFHGNGSIHASLLIPPLNYEVAIKYLYETFSRNHLISLRTMSIDDGDAYLIFIVRGSTFSATIYTEEMFIKKYKEVMKINE